MEQYIKVREYEIDGKIVFGVEALIEDCYGVYCELSSIETDLFYDSVSDALDAVKDVINGE